MDSSLFSLLLGILILLVILSVISITLSAYRCFIDFVNDRMPKPIDLEDNF